MPSKTEKKRRRREIKLELQLEESERRREAEAKARFEAEEKMYSRPSRRVMPPAPPETQMVETIRQLNTQLQEMRLELNDVRQERNYYKVREDIRYEGQKAHKGDKSFLNKAFLRHELTTHTEDTDSRAESSSDSEPEPLEAARRRRTLAPRKKKSKPMTTEPICNLPTFDGSGSLEQFKRLFTNGCRMNGWTDKAGIALWLQQCLRGRARDILYDECNQLEVLWERLTNRFGEHLLKQQYRRLLPNRKRQSGETLTRLADDIRKMSDVVYSNINRAEREDMAIQHFLAALESPSIQYDLELQEPETLDEALHLAETRESFFGRETSWSSLPQAKPRNHNQGNRPQNQYDRNNVGQLHGPNSLPQPQVPNPVTNYPQGAYNLPLQPNGWGMQPQMSWVPPMQAQAVQPMQTQGAWGTPNNQYQHPPQVQNTQPPVNPATNLPAQPNRQNRSPVCKHCKGNHPSFICRPCRHCNGPHYDNACPERGTGGNSYPISNNGPTGMGAGQAPAQ